MFWLHWGTRGVLTVLYFLPPPPQPLSLFAVQFLNAVGDLLDLIPALGLGPRPTHGDGDLGRPHMGHCSALIKVRVQRDA